MISGSVVGAFDAVSDSLRNLLVDSMDRVSRPDGGLIDFFPCQMVV